MSATYTPVIAVRISPTRAVFSGTPAGVHTIPLSAEVLAGIAGQDLVLLAAGATAPDDRSLVPLDAEAISVGAWLTARREQLIRRISAGCLSAGEADLLSPEQRATYQAKAAEAARKQEADLAEARATWLQQIQAGEAALAEDAEDLPEAPHCAYGARQPDDYARVERYDSARGARLRARRESAEAAARAALLEAYCATRPEDSTRAREGCVAEGEMMVALAHDMLLAPLGVTPRVTWDAERTHERCECEDGCDAETSHSHEDHAVGAHVALPRDAYEHLTALRTAAAALGATVVRRTRRHYCGCEASVVRIEPTALVQLKVAGRTLQVEVSL